MKMKTITLLLAVALLTTLIQAQDPFTFTYFTNDTISLELDLFVPENETDELTPLLIYVHGGGFSQGDRYAGYELARYLNSRNIACATISYTLYMKDKSFGCDGILSEKIKAIQIAASQLWHATGFVIEHQAHFQIDTSQIFISGSSAGAETVLHAAYWDRLQMQYFDPVLFPSFKYAGVIAGAGAIMDLNLITSESKIPTMLFHGDADPLVPYGVASHHYCPPDASGWLMLFGSNAIAKHLMDLGGCCQLTTFLEGDHSYAGAYFFQDQEPVADFIVRVLAGETFNQFQTLK